MLNSHDDLAPVRVLRLWVTLGLLTFAGWLVLAQAGPALPCPVKSVTGFECAFCGATRASEALLSGDIGRAIDLNLFYTLLVLPACALALIIAAGPARWENRILEAYRRLDRQRLLLEIGLTLLILWNVARNLPPLNGLAAG